MVALIILGVIVLIITVIMLIPVGVDLGYEQEKLHLSAKADGLLIQLFPKPPKKADDKPEKEKKPKKEKKKKEPKPDEEAKPKKKLKFDFNLDEIMELIRAVFRGLGKFGRKLKVSRFVLHFTAAGKDPYNTAMLYGYVNAALSSLAPLCKRRFDVSDCDVWTDVDFTADFPKLELGLAITIRIGQIVGVGLSIGFAALGILIRNWFRLKKEARENKKNGLSSDGDAALTEKETENIQEEERMAANG